MRLEGGAPASGPMPDAGEPIHTESQKPQTISIGGVTVARSPEGLPSAGRPQGTADMVVQVASEKTISGMLAGVAARQENAFGVSSEDIRNSEVKGDAMLNTLAKVESEKDRRADRIALKEERADRADTDRVNAEEERSKRGP